MDLRWALVVPTYLLGTFPTAILVGRSEGRDPTREGSGNPGASNAYRTMGRRAGVLVLLGDLCKGSIAAGAGLASGSRGVAVACGLAAVIGHVLPATRGFRGGKGVATAAGMTLVLLPVVAVVLAATWVVVAKLTKAASVASITIALALPVAAGVAGRPMGEVAAFAACGAFVIARHRANIDRLLRGEERSLREGTPTAPDA
ncbi:MAG: glycerol-3-phosphate 1-O-acyltransferase PlsY [Acidimicrobiales bacterium]